MASHATSSEVDLAKDTDLNDIVNDSLVMSVIDEMTFLLKSQWVSLANNPSIDQTLTNEFVKVNEAIKNNIEN